MASKTHKLIRKIWFTVVALFLIWQWTTYQARNLPEGIFISNDSIGISEVKDYYCFKPRETSKKQKVIFFQGGLADPKAYAPLAHYLATNGFTTYIIKSKWRLPQNDYQKIKPLFPLQQGNFVLAGHSQGAKIAAQFAFENPDLVKGLLLLGTSHPQDIDLSTFNMPSLKIYAEHDGLASVEEVMTNQNLLPNNAELLKIEGGNHSQFGYLGKLLGDNSATIPVQKQQELMQAACLQFLNQLEQQ